MQRVTDEVSSRHTKLCTRRFSDLGVYEGGGAHSPVQKEQTAARTLVMPTGCSAYFPHSGAHCLPLAYLRAALEASIPPLITCGRLSLRSQTRHVQPTGRPWPWPDAHW